MHPEIDKRNLRQLKQNHKMRVYKDFTFREEWYHIMTYSGLTQEQKFNFLITVIEEGLDIPFREEVNDEYLKGVLAKPLHDIEIEKIARSTDDE